MALLDTPVICLAVQITLKYATAELKVKMGPSKNQKFGKVKLGTVLRTVLLSAAQCSAMLPSNRRQSSSTLSYNFKVKFRSPTGH